MILFSRICLRGRGEVEVEEKAAFPDSAIGSASEATILDTLVSFENAAGEAKLQEAMLSTMFDRFFARSDTLNPHGFIPDAFRGPHGGVTVSPVAFGLAAKHSPVSVCI